MFRIVCILFGITIIAALLRYLNLSPFTIYPDSYQNLLVAENIAKFHSVVGFLGQGGMLYPDFFMWTRPVYALLINAVTFFTHDSFLSARTIAYCVGVMAIPLSFIMVNRAFGRVVGVAAAVLLALSYNHTIWSGLVMTETTGVFFMLLFLWSFFGRLKQKSELFNPADLLCGVLFAIAVLTRYEYLILILPIFYLTYTLNPKPFALSTNIASGLFFTLALTALSLFPWQSVIPVILDQLSDLLIRTGIVIVIFTAAFLGFRFIPKKSKATMQTFLPYFIVFIIGIFACYILLQFLFPSPNWLLWKDLSFIRNFARHEILLTLLSLLGIVLLFKDPTLRPYAYFSLISILTLTFIYHRINPDMERYVTHIIPFLLIPASYGLMSSLRGAIFGNEAVPHSTRLPRLLRSLAMTKHGLIPVVLLLLFVLQLKITTHGLRELNDPSWYRTSYEEKVAVKIGTWIPDQVQDDDKNELVILASMPEPYYYRLKLTTHSVSDTPPFIYIPDSLNNSTILIIEDMGMRDIFPNFTKQLDTKLQKHKKAEFKVKEPYHTANVSIPENEPVELYEIKLGELKKFIK